MTTQTDNDVQLGAVGTVLEATVTDNGVVVPLDGATTLQLKLRKPDGATTVTKTAVLSSTGLDGKMQYVTEEATDLDQAGPWKIQGYVVLPDWAGHTRIAEFKVGENL